jgi:hypothetical protein
MSEKEKLQAAAASGDVETVARVALDSAEVANRSAQTAAQTAARIAEASTRFERALAGHRKQLMLVGGISAGVALLALIIFLVAAIQLRGRVVQINSVLTVMSKRVVDLGVGLDQLASASERLDQMAAQIDSVVKEQNKMVAAVTSNTQALQAATKSLQTMSPPPAPAPAPASVAATASAPQESPQQRAQREAQSKAAAEAAQAMVAQAKALDAAIKGQARTLSSINERVQAIESKLVSTVPAVQRDLQSLLKLESERSRSVSQAASDRQREEQLRQERERFIQFRRGGEAPAQAAPAAGAAAAAVPTMPASPRQ